jgi:hypothetical protein
VILILLTLKPSSNFGQEEERRLHEIIANPMTSAEIRSNANERLGGLVLNGIQEAAAELTKLKADQ